jgi:tRNA pseudouridine55 synthase
MNNHPISKIFNIYKPAGISSADVVYHFKKNLERPFGKIGHFGTLDPFAEGVLLIGVGGACRLSDYAHEYLPKTYLATGLLGQKMSTGDIDGDVIEEKSCDHLIGLENSNEKMNQACQSFLGEYLQSPPAFSATKHKGKALYKWAREGVTISKPAVKRFIHSIEFVEKKANELTVRVAASSGTYIRTLFEDLANELDTVGHLVKLKRESIGHISSDNSLLRDKWPLKEKNQEILEYLQMPQLLPFKHLQLDKEVDKKYSNGISISINDVTIPNDDDYDLWQAPYLWVYGEHNKLIGLGVIKDNQVKACFNLPQNHS